MYAKAKTTLLVCMAAYAFGTAGPGPADALDPGAVERTVKKPFLVGVCTHFGQNKGIPEQNLQRIRGAGIGSIRDEIGWSGVEQKRGQFVVQDLFKGIIRRAAELGIAPMIIFDYANRLYDDGDRPRSEEAIAAFARYAEFLVRHFGKTVRLYEVWNEYDIGIGMPDPYRKGGSPGDYFKMLKAVYSRVKAADPGALIVGAGGPTRGGIDRGWLEDLVKLGALDFCDIVSIHTYNYGGKGRRRTPEAWAAWTENVERMLRKYNDGRDVALFVTEMGWPTHQGPRGTSPELAGSYLARLYLLARTMPYVRGIWWYDFQDDGWRPDYNEENFGIVRPDLSPKPAYYAMADIADLVGEGEYRGRLTGEDDDLWILRFQHKGQDVWAIWSADDRPRQVLLRHPAAVPAGRLTILESGRKPIETGWGYRPWAEQRGAGVVANEISLVVGARPVLVRGDLQGVVLKNVTQTPGHFPETPLRQ